MLKLSIITLGIVALSMVLLCIKMIIVPGGKFANTHIGGSKEMRRRGIHCVQSMDAIERRRIGQRRVKERKQKQ